MPKTTKGTTKETATGTARGKVGAAAKTARAARAIRASLALAACLAAAPAPAYAKAAVPRAEARVKKKDAKGFVVTIKAKGPADGFDLALSRDAAFSQVATLRLRSTGRLASWKRTYAKVGGKKKQVVKNSYEEYKQVGAYASYAVETMAVGEKTSVVDGSAEWTGVGPVRSARSTVYWGPKRSEYVVTATFETGKTAVYAKARVYDGQTPGAWSKAVVVGDAADAKAPARESGAKVRESASAKRARVEADARKIRAVVAQGKGARTIPKAKFSKSEKKRFDRIIAKLKDETPRGETVELRERDDYRSALRDMCRFNAYAYGRTGSLAFEYFTFIRTCFFTFDAGTVEKARDLRRLSTEKYLKDWARKAYAKGSKGLVLDQAGKVALAAKTVCDALEYDGRSEIETPKYDGTIAETASDADRYEAFAEIRAAQIDGREPRLTKMTVPGNNVGVAIRTGKGVCEDYADMFDAVCEAAGVECVVVEGCFPKPKEETGGAGLHAWNAVRLGGRWYHVDVTWSDGSGELKFGPKRSSFDRTITPFLYF